MKAITQMIQEDSVGNIREVLDFMLHECSQDEMPSAQEVQQWQQLLQARGQSFASLANMCATWLQEQKCE